MTIFCGFKAPVCDIFCRFDHLFIVHFCFLFLYDPKIDHRFSALLLSSPSGTHYHFSPIISICIEFIYRINYIIFYFLRIKIKCYNLKIIAFRRFYFKIKLRPVFFSFLQIFGFLLDLYTPCYSHTFILRQIIAFRLYYFKSKSNPSPLPSLFSLSYIDIYS